MKKVLTLFLLFFAAAVFAQVTIFPNGSTWKYKDDGSNQGTAWYGTGFNDASWASGPSEIGYGDGDEATVVNACGTVTTFPSCSNKFITTYVRRTFSLSSVSYTSFTASLKRDDGIVLYVNGIEVYRNNMPAGTITYTTPASAACSDDGATIFTVAISPTVMSTGTNVIAAEIHQNVGTSSDLTFELNLVGNTLPIIPVTVSLFPYGSNWKYMDDGSDQGTLWYGTSFNDAGWSSGNSEFGYGDGDETTVVNACGTTTPLPTCPNKYITTYFRKTINVSSVSSYTAYTINLRRDDGIIVYFNGTEVYRNNMPAGVVTYTTLSSTNCSDDGAQVFSATLPASVIVTGTNVIAAEVHQTGGSSSDLSFEFNLVAITNSVAIPTPTIVKGPYLQTGTQNSMFVRWETDLASDSRVMYGTNSASLSSSVINANLVTSHEIKITGLSPYTKYFYSIGTTSLVIQGDTNNYFLTSPVPGTEGKYRFWVVGDCGNASTNQVNVKNQFKSYNGNRAVDGWLTLGDNAYSNGSDPEFNAEFFSIYQSDVMKNKVLWPVPGNHDYSNGAVTSSTTPYFSIFNVPTAGEAGGVASGTKAYYSYDYGNIHFIALDSYGTVAGNKMYDTTGAQAVWLKADLAANTKKWVIAYWHHPPYTMGSHNSDSESDLVAIRQKFIRILERNKVDLILCGHSHDYERSKLMNGHYGNEASFVPGTHNLSQSSGLYDGSLNSCPYTKDSVVNKLGTVYVLSGSAGQLGGQQTSFPHNAMYYSNATNGGSLIMDIEGNRLDLKWLCADGVVRDKFTMYKDVNSVKSYTVLPNQSVNLKASWTGSVTWSDGSTTSSISVSSASTTTFWVKDPNSCIADTFKLKVLPSVDFTMAASPYCTSSPIIFSDLSTNNTTAWSWSVSPSAGVAISSASAKNPGITFSNAGIYTISLIANNEFGAGTIISKTITVVPGVSVLASLSSSAICANETATLTASGTAATYTWDSGSTNTLIVVSPAATTSYTLTGTDANGCHNISIQTLVVNPLPSVSVVSSPTNAIACLGETLSLSGSGANTYTWTGGVTNAAGFTLSAGATYTVTGTDLNGCQNSAVQTITINALPQLSVNVTPANATVCNGNTLVLSASGANTYTWSGSVTNGTSFIPSASNVYTVTATDSNGCTNTLTQSVTVNALPQLTVISVPASGIVCNGATVALTASGANTYSWSGTIANGTPFTPLTGAVYTVTGTDNNGCTSTLTQSVTVNALPQLTVTTNPAGAAVCNGSTLALTASGANTYTWSGSVTNGSSFVPSAGGTYTVTGTDNNGCKNTLTQSVTVNALPQLTISSNPASATVCSGNTLVLTASGANTYTWSGSVTNGTSFVPPASGTYTVTGTNNNGCKNTLTQSVTVNTLPQLTINVNPAVAVCNGNTLILNASGAYTYTWSGSIINGTSFIPSTSGTYTVTGTDNNGCISILTQSITVNALPQLTVNANPLSAAVCSGNTLVLTASGANTYTWTGSVTNGTAFSPSSGGVYTVTATDNNGCRNTLTQSVTVNALPQLTISTTPAAAVCNGNTLALTATGASAYIWSGSITNGTSFVPSASGTYTVTGTDNNGCSNTLTQSVTVNALPVVAIAGNTAVCSGGTLTFTASGASTYLWNTSAASAVISVTPAANTSYTVTGTDVNGCLDSESISVSVNPNPTVTVSGSMTLCAGQTATITAAGASTYSWTNGNATATLTISPSAGTDYTVTGTDANGCKHSASTHFSINPLPVITASSNNSVICVGESATLSVSGANTYTWNSSSPGTSLVVSPLFNTTYSVSGTNTNNCSASTSVLQTVSECTGLQKNSSGKNLAVYPNPNKGVFNIELNTQGNFNAEIFNALGERVYSAKLTKGNNQVILNEKKGIYFYVILDDSKIIESGKVIIE